MIKIITVIGARPQFIKASVVSHAFAKESRIDEITIHTGQHFDENMSNIFFDQLNIPRPKYMLNINGSSHGKMTGDMLGKIEEILMVENPDYVLVYGDTNSTLAGALAAAKLHIPVVHIEAGLRSFNMKMPEEINRILTDNISEVLFCPTQTAIKNLENEGFLNKKVDILNVGDVMQDSSILFSNQAKNPNISEIKKEFVLTTIHRAENTDDAQRLMSIISSLNEIHESCCQIVLPIHPRTKLKIKELGINVKFDMIDPVGYLEMLWFLKNCSLVLTDSGGVQKEAYFFGKPCVTMRDQTEWVELISENANVLVGADQDKIINEVKKNLGRKVLDNNLYGGGNASNKIVKYFLNVK